uniref:Uncharacterized protein n=1 Tax=Panagrolaimus davidi TaxID=227884 RepID=A0A914P177_9BILA
MMNKMADLYSFSPTRYQPPPEKRGILTNKTNTIATNQYQPHLNFPTLQTSAPAQQQPQAAINQYQPPKYVPPSQPPPPTAATTNQKRSNSVQSQKSIGNAAANNDEKRDNNNPTLREHPRKTIVAFGRTTKVDETIQGIRPTQVPCKHPIGSTKDIMDLRKTVEHQSTILQSQHEEIQQLKATVEIQQEKYIYLLDANTKLYERLGNLEKQISSSTLNNIKVNPVMAKAKAKEENVSCIVRNVPKDSIAIKKGSGETEKPKRENDERQLVPAQTIKPASEIDAISAVKMYLNANPNRAKDIENYAKTLQQKEQKSQSENEESEEENDRKKMEKRDHRHGHHHHHKNDNDIVEEITMKRKIYKRNNKSSTIDDSLQKFDMSMIHDNKHNNRHHHQQNRRRSPTTPTIREVSSSAASSSFESDDFVEEPRQQRSPDKRRNGRKTDSDRRQVISIEATNMPDKFDDDDMSSDPETPPTPPRRENRRQPVANRRR